eukprot:TRINITY_DN867_c0_g1_i2.p1 TRINITY_DN867_c0_g1~~TRINITY_DN867_c0_g1_i2.p1  ORF type:complete len:431 (+),score=68.66 TRINITY_DN867_c0_g1_i2:106-1398(+)
MSTWREGRSRSPRGGHGQYGSISRSLVSFGRYAHKRPQGLSVDDTGTFRLCDLMKVWGRSQGYTEEQVLEAVRRNMCYDGDRAGEMRYTLSSDSAGKTTIRVNLKGQGARWGSSTGNIDDRIMLPTPARSFGQSFVRTHTSTTDYQQTRDRWDRESWKSKSVWTPKQAKPCERAASWTWRESHNDSSRERGDGERLQRWLAYALRRGCDEELDIELKIFEGYEWAKLDDLATALGQSRLELNPLDGAGIKALVEKTDMAGRFEFSGDLWVRKVDRDQRRRREPPSRVRVKAEPAVTKDEPLEEKPGMWTAVVTPPPMAIPLVAAGGDEAGSSSSVGKHSLAATADKKEVASSADKGPPPPPGEKVGAHGQVASSADKGPPPPPGEKVGPHWQVFHDDGKIWFFYDGPLGTWWCKDKDDVPEPFVDDDDEA